MHIPDLMVQDGRPAYNVRNFGMFYKFLTTCATVYEVLPAIYSLGLTQYTSTLAMSIILAQLATLTMFNPHSHHLSNTHHAHRLTPSRMSCASRLAACQPRAPYLARATAPRPAASAAARH